MKIKKITPTDEYKHVEFGILKDDYHGRYVYTPTGFQPVLAFEYIKTGRSLLLRLSNGEELICDPGHIVQTMIGPKFAKDLDNNDILIGYDKSIIADHKPTEDCLSIDVKSNEHVIIDGENEFIKVSFEILEGPESDFYDIEIPSPHWYYTAGVLSHNTLMLCNNAMRAILDGHNVLFVTFELSALKAALRIAANLSGVNLNKFYSSNIENMTSGDLAELRGSQDEVRKQLQTRAKFGKRGKRGDLVIYELPPDECSVDDIYGIIDRNRRLRGWQPKVVVLDYLELMMSRRSHNNREGAYTQQKSVSTEVRGLAQNENVLVYTANQTNRSAVSNRPANNNNDNNNNNNSTAPPIDIDKSAESFGKNMPVDYVISMNQTADEYISREIRLWVAKNRNGPKFVAIHTSVNYDNMRISEVQ